MAPPGKKVKLLDESVEPVAHLGLALWTAARAWREHLHRAMVERGHAWYGDARGAVAAHLDPAGLAQATLVTRMGLSKQAVQQLLDGLEADGIVRRVPDPEDRRGKRVEYTARGLAAVRDANALKRRMDGRLESTLGKAGVAALGRALGDVARAFDADAP